MTYLLIQDNFRRRGNAKLTDRDKWKVHTNLLTDKDRVLRLSKITDFQ